MPQKLRGRGPTLTTLHEIETILRTSSGPLSLNEIKRRMRAKAVRHQAVRQVVDEFIRFGFVVETTSGVVWTHEASPIPFDERRWQRARG